MSLCPLQQLGSKVKGWGNKSVAAPTFVVFHNSPSQVFGFFLVFLSFFFFRFKVCSNEHFSNSFYSFESF